MAKNVQVQVAGGAIKTVNNVDTIEEVRAKLNLDEQHVATINGEPADDDDDVEDYQFIAFAPKVNGGK